MKRGKKRHAELTSPSTILLWGCVPGSGYLPSLAISNEPQEILLSFLASQADCIVSLEVFYTFTLFRAKLKGHIAPKNYCAHITGAVLLTRHHLMTKIGRVNAIYMPTE